ncbi:MAG: hypothetical protein HOP29_09810 [Phycisphaerales bacterium]|nr:hypothetical protein [Phycisphaerales bacterium]
MVTGLKLVWTPVAERTFNELKAAAIKTKTARETGNAKKATKQEGLFKQVVKCLSFLECNPRHPGLQTHEFTSIEHPYKKGEKVFEAYVQDKTPGAYRLFWCYGPEQGQITVIAITPHP